MNEMTKWKIRDLSNWCGIGYAILVFLGWGVFAGFLPATPPSTGAADIAALYLTDYTRIRIGMVVLMIAALVFIPFVASISHYMARIEGGAGVLTYTFLLGAAGNMVLTFYPAIWWLVAAFRPERAPELIYLMNDMAWLQFLGGITLYLAMPFAVAVAAFLDDSPTPTFPRWSGFLNIWLMVLLVPDQLLFFFHTGPFAWNGIFGLYLPIVGFGGFFILNFTVMRKVIARDKPAAA